MQSGNSAQRRLSPFCAPPQPRFQFNSPLAPLCSTGSSLTARPAKACFQKLRQGRRAQAVVAQAAAMAEGEACMFYWLQR